MTVQPPEIEIFTPGERPEKTVKIGDREILCRGLSESQYMQMVHEAKMLQRDSVTSDRKLSGLARFYRTMLKLIVDENDQEYVQDLIADEEISAQELIKVLRNLYDKPASAEAPAQKARRGQPAKPKQ